MKFNNTRTARERLFGELFRDYGSRIYAVCYRFTGSRDDAEDIVQTVFETLWKNMGKIEKIESKQAWLNRVAVNKCIDFKRKKHENVHFDEAIHSDTELTDRELHNKVRDAVMSLPAQQRMAIILTKYEGYSLREAGESMGISEKAAEGLVYRAKQALKELLKEEVYNG